MGDTVDEVSERGHGVRGAAALKFLWEDVLLPLAAHMRPGAGGRWSTTSTPT